MILKETFDKSNLLSTLLICVLFLAGFSIQKPTEHPLYDSKMVLIKGGTFRMGQPDPNITITGFTKDEQPAHKVTIDDFYISKYEVTQREWKEIMGESPSTFNGCDECPVETVSQIYISSFLDKLNEKSFKAGSKFYYCLPTEAQWEYAARGGRFSKGPKNTGNKMIGRLAWYRGNSGKKTHPVGKKLPNELGLYDMLGNVWEMCSDYYSKNYYQDCKDKGIVRNPEGPKNGSQNAIRGGGWIDEASACRVSSRYHTQGTLGKNHYIGFRLAAVLR